MHLFWMAGNGTNRADPSTSCTAHAVFHDNAISEESFAYAGRTLFVFNMCPILLAKVFHCAEDWIRGSLSETAKGGELDVRCQAT